MAIIKPFPAIRPAKGLEDKIAALPYDVYNKEEARVVVSNNPHSFLKIDRAETQFSESINLYDQCVYEKAHEILWEMIQNKEFIQDEKPNYYIYQLTMNQREQTGIVACASIDDYANNIIKKHENTREEKEIDRINHVQACEAQTGPIFLAYPTNQIINTIISKNKKNNPIYDFISDDSISHKVWIIENIDDIKNIYDAFEKIKNIYIADGHHRCASAYKVGLKYRQKNSDYTGKEEFNYFLSVLFPDEQLMIMDYNRVIKNLNGYDENEFLKIVSDIFHVGSPSPTPVKPSKKGEMAMYLTHTWYKVTIPDELFTNHPVNDLDVSILQDKLLDPILNIKDPKIDKNIDFVGGIRGLLELEKRVATDCKVAFAMYPTSIQELFRVADADMLMPPKSTWFEPKLRSGLFIHSLK
ncbi:MAG: DUF1015 domain-containing protein [Clostridiales bacterium]|nr:DUF1015 domain-containing protein [Clostridiales bacterium]